MTDKDTIATSTAEAHHETPQRVIIDLGSKSKKAVKRLKKGEGKLMTEVEQAIEQARCEFDLDKNKPIITVVVICKKRKKGKPGAFPCSPFSPLNLLR